MIWAYVVAGVAAAWFALDYTARRRHWRLRRASRFLAFFYGVGEGCLSCKTDYRYVLAKPVLYEGATRETARVMVPLCVSCWNEMGETERMLAAGIILQEWRTSGVYGDGDEFDQERWDAHRTQVYASVRAGM